MQNQDHNRVGAESRPEAGSLVGICVHHHHTLHHTTPDFHSAVPLRGTQQPGKASSIVGRAQLVARFPLLFWQTLYRHLEGSIEDSIIRIGKWKTTICRVRFFNTHNVQGCCRKPVKLKTSHQTISSTSPSSISAPPLLQRDAESLLSPGLQRGATRCCQSVRTAPLLPHPPTLLNLRPSFLCFTSCQNDWYILCDASRLDKSLNLLCPFGLLVCFLFLHLPSPQKPKPGSLSLLPSPPPPYVAQHPRHLLIPSFSAVMEDKAVSKSSAKIGGVSAAVLAARPFQCEWHEGCVKVVFILFPHYLVV